MDSLSYILFICLVVPMTLMLLMLRDKSRLLVGYMLIGIFAALMASEINSILLGLFDYNFLYVTTVLTPLVEELIKVTPVLFYAVVFSNRRDSILPIAFAAGVGFAMFENMLSLVQSAEAVTVGWALIRGFSTALMHAVCTVVVGHGISFVRKKRKLFYCGTFALLALASIYHGIFNMLVQSEYSALGFVLPAITYIPLVIEQFHYHKLK